MCRRSNERLISVFIWRDSREKNCSDAAISTQELNIFQPEISAQLFFIYSLILVFDFSLVWGVQKFYFEDLTSFSFYLVLVFQVLNYWFIVAKKGRMKECMTSHMIYKTINYWAKPFHSCTPWTIYFCLLRGRSQRECAAFCLQLQPFSNYNYRPQLYASANESNCSLHPCLSRLIWCVVKTLKEFNKKVLSIFFG